MNFVPYTGKKQDLSYVFEEEVQNVLKQKNIDFLSKEELLDLINSVDTSTKEKQDIIIETIKNLPANQNHLISIVKNIMTSDGRSKVLFDKTSNFDNTYNSIENDKMELVNDPRKSIISMSKLLRCDRSVMIPLFKVVTDTSIIRKNSNVTFGKLLLEVRISSPLGNFKGYITSGYLDNKYGIGFFSEYNHTIDEHTMYIIAHKTDSTPDNVVEFSIIRMDIPGKVMDIFNTYLPLNISITPLIVGNANITEINGTDLDVIRLNQSLIQESSLPENNSYIYGCGNLSIKGHGPIDCKINDFIDNNIDYSTISQIVPKYYCGNKNKVQCLSNIPMKDKIKSKLVTLRIQPSTIESVTNLPNSHIMKSTFGNSHFDMYNLLLYIYNFVSMKPYKCFGNLIINGIVIPVIGFVIDYNIGRVTFTISPFFKIPDGLKNINGIDTQYRGLRRPLIVFDTNRIVAHTYKNNGFIGDTDGNDNEFIMGFDTQRKSYKKTSKYDLSLIDITIEIPDCSGLLKQVKQNTTFRYSGDFNRYDFDFTKHDYDSYPYPAENRDISDRIENLDEIPALQPEKMILATTDNSLVFVWVDNEDEYISYTTTINS